MCVREGCETGVVGLSPLLAWNGCRVKRLFNYANFQLLFLRSPRHTSAAVGKDRIFCRNRLPL